MQTSNHKPVVLITGITGYIGSQVCLEFLKDGTYHVKGTVRDARNELKLGPLKQAFGSLYSQIELVEADLMDSHSLEKAIEGSTYVVHTASPLPTQAPKDPDLVIKPALEGTLSVMRAAHKHKVQRVVITSSCLTIIRRLARNRKQFYSEEDWSDVEACEVYDRSKVLAEKAAWDFVQDLPAHEKFELVTLLPGLVLGPTLVQTDFVSGMLIRNLMGGKMPGMPRIMFPWVDVRDVAFAHLQAIKVKQIANERVILSNDCIWFKALGETLKSQYGKEWKIKTTEIKFCLVKMVACCNKQVRGLIPYWGYEFKLSKEKSVNILKVEYHSLQQSVVDMVESLLNHGLIKDNSRPQ